jgi:hypothetical protein
MAACFRQKTLGARHQKKTAVAACLAFAAWRSASRGINDRRESISYGASGTTQSGVKKIRRRRNEEMKGGKIKPGVMKGGGM